MTQHLKILQQESGDDVLHIERPGQLGAEFLASVRIRRQVQRRRTARIKRLQAVAPKTALVIADCSADTLDDDIPGRIRKTAGSERHATVNPEFTGRFAQGNGDAATGRCGP